MTRKPTVTTAVPAPRTTSAERSPGAVETLRERLPSAAAREHTLLELLEHDLGEARGALEAVAAYVASVEAALSDARPSRHRLLGLALGGKPGDRVEALSAAVAGVRRRLAQIAVRM